MELCVCVCVCINKVKSQSGRQGSNQMILSINRNLRRLFSSFTPKRDTFTPKMTKNINKTFDETFTATPTVSTSPSSSEAVADKAVVPSGQKSYNNTYIQPGRTYHEELYASRRFELNPTQAPGPAFRKLHTVLLEEKIATKVKEKRHFVRPGLVTHATIYAGRRKKFDALVRETIQKAVTIQQSQK